MIRRSMIRAALLGLALLGAAGPAEAAARFLVACATTCTWDASTTSIWSTTSGGAGGSSVPGSSDQVTLDANSCSGGTTCTVTVNATININSLTMGAFTASTTGGVLDFSVNNNNVTAQSFNGSGTGTRTLKMGNGTWTCTLNVGTCWSFTTTTNLTFNANSSTLVFAPSGATGQVAFSTGGLTYNAVSIGAAGVWNGQSILFSGNATIATFSVAVSPMSIFFTGASTTTITNAFTIAGTSSSPILWSGGASAATVAVTNAGATCTWCDLGLLTFTTSAVNATNSRSLGALNLNGGTLTNPSTGAARIIGG